LAFLQRSGWFFSYIHLKLDDYMKASICFILLLCSLTSFAQEQKNSTEVSTAYESKKNDLYIEAGGTGLFGSLNYERQITQKPGLGLRAGIGFYTENGIYLTLPLGFNYLFPLKNKNSFIDAGMGYTIAIADANIFNKSVLTGNKGFNSIIPSVGFRKYTSKNLMWRISLSPVINNNGFVPWMGASIGTRF
jgi:hypothetical protein